MKSQPERSAGWMVVCWLAVLTSIPALTAVPALSNPLPLQSAASAITQASNARPPLSELELGTMLVRGDPEEKIIEQVQRRGLMSRPNENLFWSLTTLGASPAVLDAVRAARINPNYTPDPAWIQEVASNAESVFRAALESRGGNPVLHRLYGVALEEKGRRDEAMREYRTTLLLAPNDAAAHMLLGTDLLKQGNREAALSQFRDAVRFAPNDSLARLRLGVLLNEHREYGKAEAQLREAVRLDPGSAAAHNSLGVALEGEGNLDAALAEYREALRLKPEYAEARSNIAAIQNKMGGRAGQIGQLNQAVRRDPDDAVAHNNLGLALRDQGDLDGAIREFREAVRLKPDWAEAHSNLGKALGAKGDLDGAIAEFRSAVRLQGGVAENHFLLGAYLERKGDKTAALAAYRMALALAPGNATYKERSEFLERELATVAQPAAPAPAPAAAAEPRRPQEPADVLGTFKSISLVCRTVWMPWDDMQGALEHRSEFHNWGLSIRREGQPADVRLEIDRPLFTFDWTYNLIDPASGKQLASGKVTAWDGPTAAPELAELIMNKISTVRPSAAPAPATAAVPPAGTRVNRWPVRYMAGTESMANDSDARLVIAGGRIYVSGEQGTSFLVLPQNVIAVSCSEKIRNPAEGWYLFWSAGADDIRILAYLPIILLGGALLEQGKTTQHFVRIDWMENSVLHNAVFRVKDEEYKPFMDELQAVTKKNTTDIDAMIVKLREELKNEKVNRWVIYPDRVVQVGWKKLEPGSYVAILLTTAPKEGTIYFLPVDGNVEHVLAQAAVEVQQRRPEIEPEFINRNAAPKLSFKEENGIVSFSEIRTPDLVMRFTIVPLAPPTVQPYLTIPPPPQTPSP